MARTGHSVKVSTTLEDTTLNTIDMHRGVTNRSTYINNMLKGSLQMSEMAMRAAKYR